MCGKTCLKPTNLFFMVIFSLISIAEMICGTYILVYMYKINRPETLGHQYIAVPSLALILFGIGLLPLIVLGCCGFLKEVACCVNLYSSVLLMLAVLHILMGIFTIFTFIELNTGLVEQIREDLSYSFKTFQKEPKFVNVIQKEMECCGVESPIEWQTSLPSSCCGDSEVSCHLNSDYLYERGCILVLSDYIIFWNAVIGYALVAIGSFEVLAVIMGFSLGCGSYRYYKI